MEKDEPTIQRINYIFVQGQKLPWENLEYISESIELKKQERPENIKEQRDSIEIVAMEKAPIVTQLINALVVEARK